MSKPPVWRTVKRRCPDCDVWIVTTINYVNQGWMEEGGYKECYCWPPDHKVHQPMYLDRRTDETKIDCPKENNGEQAEG